MAEVFGHEKLKVYQKGKDFISLRKRLLTRVPRRVAARDHIDRGAESILLNIAHASSSWSPKKRIVYLGSANGSALECAACLDVFVAKEVLTTRDIYPAKRLLAEIVSMLITMKKIAFNRVEEDRDRYQSAEEKTLFSHEDLEVYQTALQVVGWLESMLLEFSCSTDLRSKLDKSTTSIVLNIAEGNGRFSGTDQSKFLGIAHEATVQSASLVDVAAVQSSSDAGKIEEGYQMLRRIAAMLASLSMVAAQHP